MFDSLYREGTPFLATEILALLEKQPELMAINSQIIRNEGYLKSLMDDGKTNVQP